MQSLHGRPEAKCRLLYVGVGAGGQTGGVVVAVALTAWRRAVWLRDKGAAANAQNLYKGRGAANLLKKN